MKYSEIGLFAVLLAVSVLVVGCVVCQTDEQYTGVDNHKLKEVKCGQTTRDRDPDRLRDVLGARRKNLASNSLCFRHPSLLLMRRTRNIRLPSRSETVSSSDIGKKVSNTNAEMSTIAA